ncbi:tripartite tricarboxylate transporter TctB family protein [soil metagenome]
MHFNRQELGVGAIFVAIGLLFGGLTLLDLDIGVARRMGPGYFPIVLSGLLIVIGIAVAVRGVRLPAQVLPPVPWRGIAFLLPLPVFFGLTIRGLGLVPVIAASTFVAAFASSKMTPILALALAAGLAAGCAVVFHYALGLPIPLFGPWTGTLQGFGG